MPPREEEQTNTKRMVKAFWGTNSSTSRGKMRRKRMRREKRKRKKKTH